MGPSSPDQVVTAPRFFDRKAPTTNHGRYINLGTSADSSSSVVPWLSSVFATRSEDVGVVISLGCKLELACHQSAACSGDQLEASAQASSALARLGVSG